MTTQMKKKINTINRSFRMMIALFLVLGTTATAFAQSPITLRIGDPAPPLKYSQWIKGTPIDRFADDQMYIVEFWATWCGPCIAQMPHLSELAEKYKGKVTVIGANVWEKTGDKPYASSLPNVVRFVEGNAKNMRFDVLADTKDQFLSNNWLKPAAVLGIPSTFIIQNNEIVWIGHPAKLDEVIDPLLAGTYDIAGNKARYDAGKEAVVSRSAKEADKYKALIEAREAKNYHRVLAVVDSLGQLSAEEKGRFANVRFEALLRVDKQEALAQAQEILKTSPRSGPTMALTIAEHDGLPKGLYQLGIDQLKTLEPMMSLALNVMALMQSKMGDFSAAVQTQQKAIDLAKKELKDPRFSGRVFEYTITDYQKQLEEYKNVAMGQSE